ncbi:MAG TPA: hypothetical protein VGY54_21490 [Polyangiaceae bacterium]|jgi:hypothetical protein|nr:hypothetical protein [Polyangiaceae bacterium]
MSMRSRIVLLVANYRVPIDGDGRVDIGGDRTAPRPDCAFAPTDNDLRDIWRQGGRNVDGDSGEHGSNLGDFRFHTQISACQMGVTPT